MKSITTILISVLLIASCGSDLKTKTVEPINQINEVKPEVFQKGSGIDDLSDSSTFRLVELESVNTHHFSEERLKQEKDKINNILPSYRYFDWENPTSGGAVHITSDDKIEVYNLLFWWADSMKLMSKEVEIGDVWSHVQGVTFGNSPSVLFTSELKPKLSQSFKLVVDELFKHRPRIFYPEGKN